MEQGKARRKPSFRRITGVSVDDPKLEAKLLTLREGEEYRVVLTYTGGWDGGLVRRTLTIATDDPKQPEIRIPVEAVLPQTPPPARRAP